MISQPLDSNPAVLALLGVASCIAIFGFRQRWKANGASAEKHPEEWNIYNWPIIGSAIGFYTKRYDMIMEGISASKAIGGDGNFSFHIGTKHIMALSGPEGRKTFFEEKGLNFAEA